MEWKVCCHASKSGDTKMKLRKTKLQDVYVIEIEKLPDERGFFGRTWDKEFFKSNGLNSELVQCNISFNKKRGTIRGLHYQIPPFEEAKLVRCTHGKVFEVVVDILEAIIFLGSPTTLLFFKTTALKSRLLR